VVVFEEAALEEHARAEEIIGRKVESFDSCAPLRYRGSHLLPTASDQRSGHFSVSAIPDYVQQDHAKPPFDWLRINVVTDNSTIIVLDREQVTKLRDMLTAWLTREAETKTAPT
jgi:hypothetical protein